MIIQSDKKFRGDYHSSFSGVTHYNIELTEVFSIMEREHPYWPDGTRLEDGSYMYRHIVPTLEGIKQIRRRQ